MNYSIGYDFSNFDDMYDCIPGVRHGVIFDFCDCSIQIDTLGEPFVYFWTNGSALSEEEATSNLNRCIKLLSYVFALPFYEKGANVQRTQNIIQQNNLLGKNNKKKLLHVEEKVQKFSATKALFEETLDLIIVALDNLYKDRAEDAFMYFFKVIEKIAKDHHRIYMQRHHTKGATKENKKKLKKLINNYTRNVFKVELTENLLDTKTDILYKELKQDYYGSTFSKISLFKSSKKLNMFDVNSINRMVKVRNKLAHGDSVNKEVFDKTFVECEYLAMQMFSIHFFNKKYEKIRIKSERVRGFDPYR